jgi:hypothetical protein
MPGAARPLIDLCRIPIVSGIGRDCSTPKGGYLQNFAPKMKMGQSEAPSYEPAVAKKALDLPGPGIRCYIEVFRSSPEEQVAHTSSYQISDKAIGMESVKCPDGVGTHLLS